MEKLPELKIDDCIHCRGIGRFAGNPCFMCESTGKDKDFDIQIFKNGKHKGRSFEEVRQNYPDYFLYLVSQPLGSVIEYVPFVNYCMDFITS